MPQDRSKPTCIRIEGALAELLWKRVYDHLDLLRSAGILDSLSGRARSGAELELCTFLAQLRFGDEDVRLRRGTGRREYFAALHAINPDIFHLYQSSHEVTIELARPAGTERLEIGRCLGYTTVVPLSQRGYDEYMLNQVSAFQFVERHILRPTAVPGRPCYIYGEGAFHISSLIVPADFSRGGTVKVSGSAPEAAYHLIRQLGDHVKLFLPDLRFTDNRNKLETSPSDRIPIFIFADNGVLARALIERGFKVPPEPFPSKGIAGYERYVLDLNDYNREGVEDIRKDKMVDMLKLHLGLKDLPGNGPTSEQFSQEFLSDVFANAALLDFYSRDGADAFKGAQIVCILHFLRDLVPFFEALVRLGAPAEKQVFFYKPYPYPQRQSVQRYLLRQGATVDSLDNLDDWLSEQERTPTRDRLLIIEDGGYITPKLLSGDFEELRKRACLVVEQTTRGKRKVEAALEQFKLKGETQTFPILSVASCRIKGELEPPHIARSFIQNLQRLLPDRMLAGTHCGVLGFGAIGREIAKATEEAGATVSVFDEDPLQRTKAHQMHYGIEVSKENILAGRSWIIGCTGNTSITEKELYYLADGTYLVSASSDQIEFAVDALQRHSARAEPFVYEGHLVGQRFELSGLQRKRIVLVANGYPLNFWGMNSMPDSVGDLIMTVLLLAAWDGLKKKPNGIDATAVDKIVSDRELAHWFDQKYEQ